MTDWQPDQYLKFKNERTQPSIDLVRRIPAESPGRIIDIGCGPGNSTAILRRRWPQSEITGLDSSAEMIRRARQDHPGIDFIQMDAAGDLSSIGRFDIVFSNAALQWMPDHETLIPRLFHLLRPGGILAVQVPFIRYLPIYTVLTDLIRQKEWAPYYPAPPEFPRHYPFPHYYDILTGLTERLELWQTDYIHILESHEALLEWYRGTGLRPYLEALPDATLRERFCSDYLMRLAMAYSPAHNGRILLPFTRIFFMAGRD